MIASKTRTEPTTTALAPNTADEAGKMTAFSEIIRKMEETDRKFVVPLLKKIEDNTSLLKKFNGTQARERAVTAKESITQPAPLSRRGEKANFMTVKAKEEGEKRAPKGRPVEAEKAVITPSVAKRVSREEATTEETLAPAEKQNGATGTVRKNLQDLSYPAPAESERDKGGRFVGKSKSQEARAEQGGKTEKKSILQSLKRGFEGIGAKGKSAMAANTGTVEEAAGRAAGGPMFEAAMEIKGAVDSARDEDSMIGKAARKIGAKIGFAKKEEQATGRDGKDQAVTATDDTDKIVESLQSSEKEDEKRHDELIKAILKGDKEGKGGGMSGGGRPENAGLPSFRRAGPGAAAREKLKKGISKPQLPTGIGRARIPGVSGAPGSGGMLGKLGSMAMKVGPLLAALPLGAIAAGVAAVGAVGAAGYSAITGKDNFINQGFKKVTGLDAGKATQADEDKINKDVLANTQRINAQRKSKGQKELEFDPVTGMVKPGAVATLSESGSGGAGTVSTGKNDAGGVSYGKKQFASAGGDKSPVAQFVKQSSHAEEFKGLAPGTPEFSKKWKDVAAADPQFGAEQDKHVAKTMSAPVVAKAVKGGFNTEDVGIREALISQSVNHGPGGNKKILAGAQAELVKRYGTVEAAPAQDQIDALTVSRKNYVNQVAENKAVTAQKLRSRGDEKGAVKAEGEAGQLRTMASAGGRYDQENAITRELSATGGFAGKAVTAQKSKATEPATQMTATEAAPVPIATKMEKQVTDTRQRILASTRAKTAAMGAGSLEAKPIGSGVTAAAEPTSLATGMPARAVSPPERMQQPVPEDQQKASRVARAGTSASGEGAATGPGMEKLMAMMTKVMGGKESAAGQQQIRTEFDDTMLTLMAYDRV